MNDQSELERQVDVTVNTVNQLIKERMLIDQSLSHVVPMLTAFVSYVGLQMKAAMAVGAVVADGKGGIMPAPMQQVDPKTGPQADKEPVG